MSIYNFLKKQIRVENRYFGLKRYLIIHLFFFDIKIPRNNYSKIRDYIRKYKPQLSPNVTQIISKEKVMGHSRLAVCAIFKNEPDIVEWLEYHIAIGVQKFFLYDNESDGDVAVQLKPYIDKGVVIYHKIIGDVQQIPAYLDVVCRYKNCIEWLAFIDLDEYIVPIEKFSLIDFLDDYKNEVAVGINWVMFDSNGHKKRPVGFVIENYLRRDVAVHSLIKSISKASEIAYISNPHFCFYKNSRLAVNENYKSIGSAKTFFVPENAFVIEPSTSKIQINHYQTKSEEDYLRKCNTGFSDRADKRILNPDLLNFKNYSYDDKILKYVDFLKRKE